MLTATCQRWRDRWGSAVPAGSLIDPSILAVDVIDETRAAKPFVVQHHYSGTFPAAELLGENSLLPMQRTICARQVIIINKVLQRRHMRKLARELERATGPAEGRKETA